MVSEKIKNNVGRMRRKRREKTQITKVRIERGETATDPTDIKKFWWEYYRQLCQQIRQLK